MKIKVNSNPLDFKESNQLVALLKQLSLAEKSGMAIAVNAAVIPKKEWSEFVLQENDEIIIIEAAQGG